MGRDSKVRVSDLGSFHYGMSEGDEEAVASSIVNYMERLEPKKSNSELLYPLPEEVEIGGLIHDAIVHHYDETEGGPGKEMPADEIKDRIVKGLKGKDPYPELLERSRRLIEKFPHLEEPFNPGKDPALEAEYRGRTVEEWIEKFADYRAENMGEDDMSGTEKEVNVSSDKLTGRIDLLLDGEDIIEVKTGFPRENHLLTSTAYWMMRDDEEADVFLDYPLMGNRKKMEEGEGREVTGRKLSELEGEVKNTLKGVEDAISELNYLLGDSFNQEELDENAKEVAGRMMDYSRPPVSEEIDEKYVKFAAAIMKEDHFVGAESGKKRLPEVVDRWKELTDRSERKLWEVLDQFYLNGYMDAWDDGDQMIIELDDIENMEDLRYIEREPGEDGFTGNSMEFAHGEVPSLPAWFMHDHLERWGEVDTISEEDKLVAAERESGGKRLRYVASEEEGRGVDRISLYAMFPESFFTERHRERYLESLMEDQIVTLAKRTGRLRDAAERSSGNFEDEEELLEELETVGKHYFDPDEGNHVEAAVEAYLESNMNRGGSAKLFMDYAKEMEQDTDEDYDIRIADTEGDTKKAKDRRAAKKSALEYYIETVFSKLE